MGLVKATIHSKARTLLNEAIAGYWLDSEINGWIDDAATDISTKTYCYEISAPITLLTSQQLYTLPDECLKALGVIYANKGLKRIVPWMEGLQTAIISAVPDYFFEITDKIGFTPIPTASENTKIATLYYAKVTNDITKIPLKFQVATILFVVSMALLKERQYAKSSQILQIYISLLNMDKSEVEIEKVEQPQPQNNYVLKLIGPQ